ncbi:translocation/assembly module TamB domain-containing protein [Aquimarina brevivitae]|uniref:Autotransporter translocation and assembly factor TamB n=1 Tax=Aquimarina brevivitae TaxID=323412 RepID=A0A4Q7P0Y3_9FLAO|nr:translocation/assembly module TamB [Aquimarina brevivitae]RZS92302.1 autotransporter translocation and assembly factor TamB [Aquimarina brevivitae]
MTASQQKKWNWKKKIGILLLSLFVLFVLIVLFIRSPWGQGIIVDKTVSYLKDKTGTEVQIDKLYLSFSGNLMLKGFYVEDQKQDTLVYSKSLEASIKIYPLIKAEGLHLQFLDWEGVVANIERKSNSDFNYQFIIDSLSTPTDSTKTEENGSFEIVPGTIEIKDVALKFQDEQTGSLVNLSLGNLATKVESFYIDKLDVSIASFSLRDTKITVQQSKAFNNQPEANSTLPNINVEEVKLSNVSLDFKDASEKIVFTSFVEQAAMEDTNLDLRTQNISVESFELHNSTVYFKNIPSGTANQTPSEGLAENITIPFTWPEWKVIVDHFSVTNQSITYLTKSINKKKDTIFDPEAFTMKSLYVNFSDLKYEPQALGVKLNSISFQESSGFQLKKLSAEVSVTDTSSQLSSLVFKTNQTSVQGAFAAKYHTIQDVFNAPAATKIDIKLPALKISLRDIQYFIPSILDNCSMATIAKRPVEGTIHLDGVVDDLAIHNTSLKWGDSTSVALKGHIKNSTQFDSLYVDLPMVSFETYSTDIEKFISTDTLGLNLPDHAILQGAIVGNLNQLNTDVALQTTLGSITGKGLVSMGTNYGFKGKVAGNQIQLGKLLNTPQLGTIELLTEGSLQGNSLADLDMDVQTSFQKLELFGYDYKALQIDAAISKGKGKLKTSLKDKNLNMQLAAQFDLDSISPSIDLTGKVIGADLKALGITARNVKTQFNSTANFTGNLESFTASLATTKATVVYQQEPFSIRDIKLLVNNKKDKTEVTMDSGFLNGSLNSNSSVPQTLLAIKAYLLDYINPKRVTQKKDQFVNSSLQFTYRDSPIISKVFVTGFKPKDTIAIKGTFQEEKNLLTSRIETSRVVYGSSSINNLKVVLDGSSERLKFDVAWDSIVADPLFIENTAISGVLKNQQLKLNFDSFDVNKKNTAHLLAEVAFTKDTLNLHIDPTSLILDRTPWQINPNNKMIIAADDIIVNDFTIARDRQSLTIATQTNKTQQKELNFNFKNFKLNTLTSYFNENQQLISGEVNGEVSIVEPFAKTAIAADIAIDQLAITEIPLGKLDLEANSTNTNDYTLNLKLKGDDIDFNLKGAYTASQDFPKVDLVFDLERLNINMVEKIFDSSISNASGNLSAKGEVTGDLNAPNYMGDLTFNNTAFSINSLNTKFILPKENIQITNDGIFLDQFTIKDSKENSFTLDGAIMTDKSINNPEFDLRLSARDFQILSSTKEDNDLFYGDVSVATDFTIKGSLEVPKIRGDLKLDSDSSFTLVVPESELEIKEREGVVLFVNRENPDAILTRVDETKSEIPFLQGFDIQARVQVGKQSEFKVVIDKSSGDYITVHGTGDLVFGIEPNGRTTLSGRYEISDGLYKASLYDIISREFKIKPGSSIAWNGEPLEADIDVTAIYSVEASPLPLVKSLTDLTARDVEVLVYLNVDGELLKPEISFELDMPESDRGVMGGAIYGQVKRLNNEESELNKQVFSLLVLKGFYPDSGSDGSTGGVASLAKDNVNSVLAGQLNTFGDKIVGKSDIDLNFDLNTYGTYKGNTATEATDLEINAQKSFLDNRLIVRVGSEVNIEGNNQATETGNPIIGNVSVEYLLTENGRFRVKGFRKNKFESVIDGQLVVTGIALIFNREFNKFKDLWRDSVAKELKRKKELEKLERNNK